MRRMRAHICGKSSFPLHPDGPEEAHVLHRENYHIPKRIGQAVNNVEALHSQARMADVHFLKRALLNTIHSKYIFSLLLMQYRNRS